ncbi:hypothetical protein HK097_006763 [Rhizophlyctis rosea]|uniref:Fork-head domain-containing protein n=1 Tax=Rhizophlyctis rosea TaxID=64517 RepID=A0AAD5SFF8_9FUNG|nr:hypothetical protein HK097_006763 [Rhizophlyctis rosea]
MPSRYKSLQLSSDSGGKARKKPEPKGSVASAQGPDRELTTRPPFSYAELISEAINSTEEGSITLKDMYAYINGKYPYYGMDTPGWQNCVRHTLSLNKEFVKKTRTEKGKGDWWSLESLPSNSEEPSHDYPNVPSSSSANAEPSHDPSMVESISSDGKESSPDDSNLDSSASDSEGSSFSPAYPAYSSDASDTRNESDWIINEWDFNSGDERDPLHDGTDDTAGSSTSSSIHNAIHAVPGYTVSDDDSLLRDDASSMDLDKSDSRVADPLSTASNHDSPLPDDTRSMNLDEFSNQADPFSDNSDSEHSEATEGFDCPACGAMGLPLEALDLHTEGRCLGRAPGSSSETSKEGDSCPSCDGLWGLGWTEQERNVHWLECLNRMRDPNWVPCRVCRLGNDDLELHRELYCAGGRRDGEMGGDFVEVPSMRSLHPAATSSHIASPTRTEGPDGNGLKISRSSTPGLEDGGGSGSGSHGMELEAEDESFVDETSVRTGGPSSSAVSSMGEDLPIKAKRVVERPKKRNKWRGLPAGAKRGADGLWYVNGSVAVTKSIGKRGRLSTKEVERLIKTEDEWGVRRSEEIQLRKEGSAGEVESSLLGGSGRVAGSDHLREGGRLEQGDPFQDGDASNQEEGAGSVSTESQDSEREKLPTMADDVDADLSLSDDDAPLLPLSKSDKSKLTIGPTAVGDPTSLPPTNRSSPPRSTPPTPAGATPLQTTYKLPRPHPAKMPAKRKNPLPSPNQLITSFFQIMDSIPKPSSGHGTRLTSAKTAPAAPAFRDPEVTYPASGSGSSEAKRKEQPVRQTGRAKKRVRRFHDSDSESGVGRLRRVKGSFSDGSVLVQPEVKDGARSEHRLIERARRLRHDESSSEWEEATNVTSVPGQRLSVWESVVFKPRPQRCPDLAVKRAEQKVPSPSKDKLLWDLALDPESDLFVVLGCRKLTLWSRSADGDLNRIHEIRVPSWEGGEDVDLYRAAFLNENEKGGSKKGKRRGAGKYVAFGGEDGVLRVWDVEAGEVRNFAEVFGNWINDIQVHPTSKLVFAVTSRDGAIRIINAKTLGLVAKISSATYLHAGGSSVTFSPDGKYLIGGAYNSTLSIWSLDSPEFRRALGYSYVAQPHSFPFEPGVPAVFVRNETVLETTWVQHASLDWMKCIGTFLFVKSFTGNIRMIKIPKLAEITRDKREAWRMGYVDIVHQFDYTGGSIEPYYVRAALSESGNLLAVGSEAGWVIVWCIPEVVREKRSLSSEEIDKRKSKGKGKHGMPPCDGYSRLVFKVEDKCAVQSLSFCDEER